jgi:hypothetical protein
MSTERARTVNARIGLFWLGTALSLSIACSSLGAGGLQGATASPEISREVPTLSIPWSPDQRGWGLVKPTVIFNGGDESGQIADVRWESWGGPTAIGHGTASYALGPTKAHSVPARATVVATKLKRCNGQLMYTRIWWYFPRYGEDSSDPTNPDAPDCPQFARPEDTPQP